MGRRLGSGEVMSWRIAERMLLGTGRNLRPVQRGHFCGTQTENEALREPPSIALDLFVQPSRGHAVEASEIGV
jgi:hypothetical protein